MRFKGLTPFNEICFSCILCNTLKKEGRAFRNIGKNISLYCLISLAYFRLLLCYISFSNVMRDVHWCVTVDLQQIENGNIANQIHGFTIDYGKFILITNSSNETTGPSATILNASQQHFTEKILIFNILPLGWKQISCNINEPKQCISTWQTAWQTTEMSILTEQRIGSFETKANRQWTEVACPRLNRRSWGGTRVCVEAYFQGATIRPIVPRHKHSNAFIVHH